MSEKVLLNVIQEAYIHGVSTRKVNELVKALGMEGIIKLRKKPFSKNLSKKDLRLLELLFSFVRYLCGLGRKKAIREKTESSVDESGSKVI